MPINPDAKKWVIITVVVCVALFLCGYFSFQHGTGIGAKQAQKAQKHLVDSVNRRDDSLMRDNDRLNEINDQQYEHIDTLNRNYEIMKAFLVKNAQDEQALKSRYAAISRIDQFKSDSLRAYFLNNFDTTKPRP